MAISGYQPRVFSPTAKRPADDRCPFAKLRTFNPRRNRPLIHNQLPAVLWSSPRVRDSNSRPALILCRLLAELSYRYAAGTGHAIEIEVSLASSRLGTEPRSIRARGVAGTLEGCRPSDRNRLNQSGSAAARSCHRPCTAWPLRRTRTSVRLSGGSPADSHPRSLRDAKWADDRNQPAPRFHPDSNSVRPHRLTTASEPSP